MNLLYLFTGLRILGSGTVNLGTFLARGWKIYGNQKHKSNRRVTTLALNDTPNGLKTNET
jgi:hypothetical protein